MTTKLSFIKANKIREIGYCRETPQQVLDSIYRSHDVYKYRDITFPTSCGRENKYSGLIIQGTEAPVGTAVISSINDYGLGFALKPFNKGKDGIVSHPAFDDNEEIYFDALKNAIRHYLGKYSPLMNGSYTDYLSLRSFIENPMPMPERLVKQLQEIAEVTLKVRNPTPGDLELVLNF